MNSISEWRVDLGRPISLIDFLSQYLELSKSKCKRILDEKRVRVNQRLIWMAQHQLKKGDRVWVQMPEPVSEKRVPIVYTLLGDNPQYLVVNKPAGILSNKKQSLEELIRKNRHDPKIQAIHRLDRDTSGAILFAKSQAVFETFKDLFREQQIKKDYLGICWGELSFEHKTIRTPLDGLTAITHIKKLQSRKGLSLIQLGLETGRTHQIRKHLAQIGHPLWGEREYLSLAFTEKAVHSPRQMLHGWKLAFRDPWSSQPKNFTAPLPEDFKKAASQAGFDLKFFSKADDSRSS